VQTYLDAEIRRMRCRMAKTNPELRALLAAARDDGEALLKLARQLAYAYPRPDLVARRDRLAPGFGEWTVFVTLAAAVVREPDPEAAEAPPLRIALTRETAGMLAGARTGPAIAQAFSEILAARRVLYLDIASGGLVVGERLQVRALIAAVSSPSEKPTLTAVLTPRGSERGCRVTCLLGARHPRERLWSAERAAFDPEEALQGSGVDLDAVLQAAEDLLALAVVHAETTSETGGELPYAPPGDPRRQGRRGQKKAKKWSLFRVQRLAPPRDRRGHRMPGGAGGGTDLTVRQTVQGHFKLQPCGPGHQRRRLIYVHSYERGPADGRRRGALHVARRAGRPGDEPAARRPGGG